MTARSVEGMTQIYDELRQTTKELDVNSRTSWAGHSLTEALLMFMCVLAFTANLAMLINLIVYKQTARKTVNTFVCNQTALDATAAFFAFVKASLFMSGYLNTKTGVLRTFVIKRDVFCVVRQSLPDVDTVLLTAEYC